MLNVSPDSQPPKARQPVFNLPLAVTALIGLVVALHAVRVFVLDGNGNLQLILRLAFIPLRETDPSTAGLAMPVGGERIWTFVTYGLLHADWSHLIFNSLWLAAFGSPLAWRFGAARFLLFSAAGAAAGAAIHLAIYPQQVIPLVGASAAISAHMAAAARFVFARGGPMFRLGGPASYRLPAAPLGAVIGDRRVLTFLGVWFGLNLLFGLSSAGANLTSGAIAWEAHIGGFLAGLFLFPLFDPVNNRPS